MQSVTFKCITPYASRIYHDVDPVGEVYRLADCLRPDPSITSSISTRIFAVRGRQRSRIRCGDGPCRLRAIPSGRALRCNLRSAPIFASIPIASARWRSLRAPLAGPAPETRVSIPEPPRASVPIANNIPLDVMAHCPTRARCANPQGVLLSAPLRSGLGSQGYGAKAPRRAKKRDRGSALPAVACAPAPLAPLAAPGLAATVALLRARGPLNHHVRRLSPHNEP